MCKLQLVLARHGRTPCNVAKRIQGHSGSGLDDVGQKQAERLANRLQQEELVPDQIYSSDLLRAYQTAQLVGELLQVPCTTDKRLRECGFGRLEYLTHEAVLSQYGQELAPHLAGGDFAYDFRAFGGEQYCDVIARQESFLREVALDSLHERLLIIGHGRSLNNLLVTHWRDKPPIKQNCDYRVVTWPGT